MGSERRVKTRASTSGNSDWLEKLRKDDPKGFEKLCKSMDKHVKMGGEGKSVSMVTWKQKYSVRSGNRASGRHKWMWENEYIEHKNTTAEGNWPRKRAAAEWDKMMQDPRIRKKDTGPDGQPTIKIKLGDYESSFDEESEVDEIEAIVQQKKKITQEGVREMAARSGEPGGAN